LCGRWREGIVEEKRGVGELELGLKKSGPRESGSEWRRRFDTVDAPIGNSDFHSSENSIASNNNDCWKLTLTKMIKNWFSK